MAEWKFHDKILAIARSSSTAQNKMSQYRANIVPACFEQGEICLPLWPVPSQLGKNLPVLQLVELTMFITCQESSTDSIIGITWEINGYQKLEDITE